MPNKRLPVMLVALAAMYGPCLTASTIKDSDTFGTKQMTKVDQSDLALIEEVLMAYTSSVSSGDRARFEKLLLDPDIPFFGLDDNRMPSEGGASLRSVQQFAGFRKAVFESGQKYTQRFFNVKVECDGDLAQVSLNFETRLVGTDEGARGWKILHMLRVNGQWKIASEFYTAFDLTAKNR